MTGNSVLDMRRCSGFVSGVNAVSRLGPLGEVRLARFLTSVGRI